MNETVPIITKKAFTRDLTKGSIVRNLLHLSWPMIATESLYTVTILEMVWIGRLGAASLAGVGIAFLNILLVMTALMGLSIAARAMVSRFIGAGDEAGANHVMGQAFLLSIIYGLVTTVVGITLAGPIMGLYHLEQEAMSEGVAYLRMYSVSWIPLSFWLMLYTIIQASGDSITTLKIEAVMRVAQAFLSPFFILGWWIFPKMGVTGAALCGVIIEILGTSLALWFLLSGRTRLQLSLRSIRPDFRMMWRIIRVGLPACVMNLQGSIAGVIIAGFMIPFGTLAVAAHSLLNRLQLMIFLPTMGLSTGAGVLTGQNLGARQPDRAEKTGWIASGLTGGFSFIFSLVILMWADEIAGIFSPADPGLVTVAGNFLRIAAVGFLVSGFSSALQSCITGAGETLVPMVVAILSIWCLQIPLAYFLPKITDWGVYGVRWAMVSPMLVGIIVYTIYFRMGRWKRKKV
jgi:putative MATE family efflux protein